MERRAKIVATLGPASESPEALRQLLAAGVDVVRLNLSHGTAERHRETLRRVRQAAAEADRHIPVLADLMGPRYRLGTIADAPRELQAGETVSLGEDAEAVDLPLDSPELLAHLRPGERVLIDNGLVELAVEEVGAARVNARVVTGGPVSTRKGINLPDTDVPFTISEKDEADIRLAVEEEADYLAASYVGRGGDLDALREVMDSLGAAIPLVAKLERGGALTHLDEIVAAADGLMVARGDLGVEVPLHRVPVMQKQIVEAGRRAGKPVIVATQMLESMIERPRPTRAEASDVANAVFDGADALMLSGESAVGRHPVAAVRTMAEIISEAEQHSRATLTERRLPSLIDALELPHTLRPERGEDLNPERDTHFEIPDVVAAAAVFTARELGVRQIVAFSQGGFTARSIARYRPPAPIVVFTNEPQVARRIQLLWGVRPLTIDTAVEHHDEVVRVVDRELLEHDLASPGEPIIILMGDPIRDRPLTNLMRVHRVRA
ncbi:MAG: pyruvate kinase [Thermoanaerobaculia bacterium]